MAFGVRSGQALKTKRSGMNAFPQTANIGFEEQLQKRLEISCSIVFHPASDSPSAELEAMASRLEAPSLLGSFGY